MFCSYIIPSENITKLLIVEILVLIIKYNNSGRPFLVLGLDCCYMITMKSRHLLSLSPQKKISFISNINRIIIYPEQNQ